VEAVFDWRKYLKEEFHLTDADLPASEEKNGGLKSFVKSFEALANTMRSVSVKSECAIFSGKKISLFSKPGLSIENSFASF